MPLARRASDHLPLAATANMELANLQTPLAA
jgi:hypothetical protein